MDNGIVAASEMIGRKSALQELEEIVGADAVPAARLLALRDWRTRWVEEGSIRSEFDAVLARSLTNAARARAGEDEAAVEALLQGLAGRHVVMLRDGGLQEVGAPDQTKFPAYVSLITVTALRAKPREG